MKEPRDRRRVNFFGRRGGSISGRPPPAAFSAAAFAPMHSRMQGREHIAWRPSGPELPAWRLLQLLRLRLLRLLLRSTGGGGVANRR